MTPDKKVSFLKLTRETGVTVPLMSTGDADPVNFTVMLWFKFEPSAEDQDLMQIFSFNNSAACFLSKSRMLICENGDRKKLTVSTESLKPGLWFHLTLSVPADGKDAFLMLQNNNEGVLATAVNDPATGPYYFE